MPEVRSTLNDLIHRHLGDLVCFVGIAGSWAGLGSASQKPGLGTGITAERGAVVVKGADSGRTGHRPSRTTLSTGKVGKAQCDDDEIVLWGRWDGLSRRRP